MPNNSPTVPNQHSPFPLNKIILLYLPCFQIAPENTLASFQYAAKLDYVVVLESDITIRYVLEKELVSKGMNYSLKKQPMNYSLHEVNIYCTVMY